MPIYEYRCKECHQIFEEWSKHEQNAAPRSCPICNGPARRLSPGGAFAPGAASWRRSEGETAGEHPRPPAGRGNPA